MNKFFTIILPVLLLATSLAHAADTAVVQVKTVALKQQQMTSTVSGYGSVSPDTRSLETISLPRPGQIVRLLVSPGQPVKKGSVLLRFGTGADAAMNYQQARQAVDFAMSETKRIGQLVAEQLATQSQLAAANKALADSEAALHAQEKIGAGRTLEQVTAPFNGIVMSVQSAQGDRLVAGAPLLQLARSGGQRVLLGVEPDDARLVRPGMPVSIAPVFSSEAKVSGRVAQVFGMINPQTQLVDVLVKVAKGELMPGTRVYAEIEVARQTAWVVPRSAVLQDANGAYLFQVAQGKAHRINVQTGLEQNGLISVQGTFDTAQTVVSLGNYELADGMAVSVAMAAREGGQ
jgi:membrane fusion protein (multidrug efflux system)